MGAAQRIARQPLRVIQAERAHQSNARALGSHPDFGALLKEALAYPAVGAARRITRQPLRVSESRRDAQRGRTRATHGLSVLTLILAFF
ncbi:MAG: hypothetical protein GDA40_01765 [Rhodobacteraceae bacterium]|nr:hypothetical protein [Paracoccaceae bacterium]